MVPWTCFPKHIGVFSPVSPLSTVSRRLSCQFCWFTKVGVKALRSLSERIKGKEGYMPLYEHTFMARQDISGQQTEALVEHFKTVLEENGGTVGKVENWGLRSIAYRVNKNRKAHYLHMNVDAPASALSEMERQMRIHEDILRYMTIRVDEHEEGPSAMMKKNDRDGRPPRGDRDDRPPRREREEKTEETSAAPAAEASEE